MTDVTPTLASGQPQRPRTQLVATGFASAICAMMMAGLLAFIWRDATHPDHTLAMTGLMD